MIKIYLPTYKEDVIYVYSKQFYSFIENEFLGKELLIQHKTEILFNVGIPLSETS